MTEGHPGPMRAAATSLLIALLLGGCGPVDEAPIVLFGGFRYDWLNTSHRVAQLRAITSAPDADGAFTASLGTSGAPGGGDVPEDSLTWGLAWHAVTSDRVRVVDGETAVTVDGTGVAVVPVVFDLDAAGLQDWTEVTVALRGMDLDATGPLVEGAPGGYDPALGWSVVGLGAGIGEPARTARTVEFEVWVHFDAAPIGDDAMSANTEHASVQAVVAWSVVASRASTRTSGRLTASDLIRSDGSWAIVTPLPAAERTLSIQGRRRYHLGLPLLRSWDLALNQGVDGRHLRAFGVRIADSTYDWRSGWGAFAFDLHCSHSAEVEAGDLAVDFAVQLDLLQVDDADGEVVLHEATGDAGSGQVDVVLP